MTLSHVTMILINQMGIQISWDFLKWENSECPQLKQIWIILILVLFGVILNKNFKWY